MIFPIENYGDLRSLRAFVARKVVKPHNTRNWHKFPQNRENDQKLEQTKNDDGSPAKVDDPIEDGLVARFEALEQRDG